jgi:LPXTG-motif cell wall-anchored protein
MGTAAIITAITGLVTALGATGWFARRRSKRKKCEAAAKLQPPLPPSR